MDITKTYAECPSIFVFPSQIAADSVAEIVASKLGVALNHRFISWDRFKASVFPQDSKHEAVSVVQKILFLYYILEKNTSDVLFQELVQPKFRSEFSLHIQSLLSLLPDLQFLTENSDIQDMLARSSQSALWHDFRILYREYKTFLHKIFAYEKLWRIPEYRSNGKSYILFNSELLNDFPLYKDMLETRAEVSLEKLAIEDSPARTRTFVFSDFREELHACLHSISLLLKEAVPADSIAITLADHESLYPRLQYFAENMGIPIVSKKARALIEFPSLSWLRSLFTGGFSFNSMRRILLNANIPWKDMEVNRKIILRAIQEGVIEAGYSAWKNLARAVSQEASRVIEALHKMLRAQSIDELYARIYYFIHEHCNTELWNVENEAAWQQGIVLLNDAKRGIEQFPELNKYCRQIFVDILSRTYYLAQNSSGVAVYDFPAAAALNIRHHYCLNFNAESTTIAETRFHYLNDELRSLILEQFHAHQYYSNIALQGRQIESYGEYAVNAWLSYSKKTLASRVLPAPFFREHNGQEQSVEELQYFTQKHAVGTAQNEDYKRRHKSSWNVQVLKPEHGYDKSVEHSITHKMLSKSLSISKLESWLYCPLGYFWNYFALKKLEMRPVLWPVAKIGSLFHSCMEKIYRVFPHTFVFDPREYEHYCNLGESLIHKQFSNTKNLRGIPRMLHSFLEEDFTAKYKAILKHEVENWREHHIFRLEQNIEFEMRIEGILRSLTGRIDKILQNINTKTLAIIDYKYGRTAENKDLLGGMLALIPSQSDQKQMGEQAVFREILEGVHNEAHNMDIRSVQLAAYAIMLNEGGESVESAGYMSTRRTDVYLPVIQLDPERFPIKTKPMLPLTHPQFLEIYKKYIEDSLRNMHSEILSGNFKSPASFCSACRQQSLCRQRFAIV